MMFSDDRKYTLSGWLQVHERKVYDRPYQLQILKWPKFWSLQYRAKRCAFMVQTRTEEEWSSFTKRLNIWKAKEIEIFKHERKMAELDWDDFNDADINLITMLANQYPSKLVENSKIIAVKEKKYVVSRVDYEKIIQNHMERLEKLAKKPKLHNPVFVKLDDEGKLVVE